MEPITERAPAKINLTLALGPTRDTDGRHELVTVFEPLTLHDEVTLSASRSGMDEVDCEGVTGPNLASRALDLFREATGWDGPAVRLTIVKRIPVAAGMAGGSADAAAALRLAQRASGGLASDDLLHELAFALGADVPAQLRPRRALGTGAGERLRGLPQAAADYGVLVLPSAHELSTGAVFAQADELELARDEAALAQALHAVERGDASGPLAHATGGVPLVNDLEPAARALQPAIDEALDVARAAGADHAMVSGSGPTVLGLFADPARARQASEELRDRTPAPILTGPLREA
jgi:4-diphosphocytidyl-2-C-methyl-D-erythritol kinase